MVVITGTSSGIGKAVAEFYLSKGESVIGIGRRHTISHPDYQAVVCDLSDQQAVEALEIEVGENCVLINNAGILGNVQRISDQERADLSEVLQVNVVAPAILMNKLSKSCGDEYHLTVVNISSGAAKRAIPSWAAYCSSKAALEMLSETFFLEEREKGRTTKVYCVAPGVVDTGMQAKIRTVSPEDFSASAGFHTYKKNNELADPAEVAAKLYRLLQLPYYDQVNYSLRDIM